MALSLKDLKLVDSMYAYTKSRYIMALDCGTTSVRAVIVDEYGCIVAQASRPVKAIYPPARLGGARPHRDPGLADRGHDGGAVQKRHPLR